MRVGSYSFSYSFSLCGERGIRTPGGLTLNGFQDRRNRPLCHLSGGKGKSFLFTQIQKNAKNLILMYFFGYSSCISHKIKLLEISGVLGKLENLFLIARLLFPLKLCPLPNPPRRRGNSTHKPQLMRFYLVFKRQNTVTRLNGFF